MAGSRLRRAATRRTVAGNVARSIAARSGGRTVITNQNTLNRIGRRLAANGVSSRRRNQLTRRAAGRSSG